MAKNDAFTAGVRPGGLTGSTEIRLLLCYLIKNAAPICRQELETALLDEALVNYFEIGGALEDIVKQGLAEWVDGQYHITPRGDKVAEELAYELPRSGRDRAIRAVLRAQVWNQKSAQYHAELTGLENGRYLVDCMVTGVERDQFNLRLTMPDRQTAELVQQQFVLRGNEVYRLLIEQLTQSEE
ncbi:MAG: DUF4364 family protein [Faecalibacterium sp.]|nr:DUF4364 family protein [Faecalibacterium sp.]